MNAFQNPNAAADEGLAATQSLDDSQTDDLRIEAVRPLLSPALLVDELPASAPLRRQVRAARAAISDVLHGRDDRLLVVVGPCSIHDHEQALDYARKLKVQADQLSDDLLIVMRVYFEKPRTTVGWKGLINDPRLDGSFRINEGLRRARELLLQIGDIGLPAGVEYLDLLSPQYLSDLVAWGAIGARTTESQSHRQLASGLSCPIGFKNGTDGGLQVAVDAVVSARAPHSFMGMTKMGVAAIFQTRGNDDCHVILRGGKSGTNFDAASVEAGCQSLAKASLPQVLMIDCSHANSQKKHENQIAVAADIGRQVEGGDQRIIGVMIESNLEEGRQDQSPGQPLKPGVSITDACLSWVQTEPVLTALAQSVRQRRAHRG